MNYCLNIHKYDAYFDQLFFKPLAIFKINVKIITYILGTVIIYHRGGGGGVWGGVERIFTNLAFS